MHTLTKPDASPHWVVIGVMKTGAHNEQVSCRQVQSTTSAKDLSTDFLVCLFLLLFKKCSSFRQITVWVFDQTIYVDKIQDFGRWRGVDQVVYNYSNNAYLYTPAPPMGNVFLNIVGPSKLEGGGGGGYSWPPGPHPYSGPTLSTLISKAQVTQ